MREFEEGFRKEIDLVIEHSKYCRVRSRSVRSPNALIFRAVRDQQP